MRNWVTLAAIVLATASGKLRAETDTYKLPDPQLSLSVIDSDPKESFLAVHLDPAGRLFVGGREGLFVYEPDGSGGFGKRQELLRLPKSAWVYDITTHGNDLYIATVSAIYFIPDGVIKRENLTVKRLIWGIPLGHVHQCFHNFEWGPEGDLYFTCGDPLTSYGDFRNRADHWGHWTWFVQPEGTKVEYNGVGGIFHVHPDGSNLQFVAGGLRNSLGLSFDADWNLFTNDNDHESIPAEYVPGRLIHVTPGSYFSWPRGWMPSKQPNRADLLLTMNDHLGRYVPVGEVVYDDTLLPEKYRNTLIVDRWGEHKLVYNTIKPNGATFKSEEHDLLLCQGDARPVGVAVGSGGRIFATVCYMAANDSSPVYRSDIVVISPKDAKVDPASYDIAAAPAMKLYAELSSPDWSRRHAACTEILRRGGAVLEEAPSHYKLTGSQDPAWLSLIWLTVAGQGAVAKENIESLAANSDELSRLQAIRAIAAYSELPASAPLLIAALNDSSLPVRLAAINAIRVRLDDVPEAIVQGPARSDDTYLRQTATNLMAAKLPESKLATLTQSPDAKTRLAAILAIGTRLTVPPATGLVPEQLALDAKAQAGSYVINNIYQSEPVDLRKLGRVGNYTMAQWWKQVPHTPEQEQLFGLLRDALGDSDSLIRNQSAFYLNLLNDPTMTESVGKIFAEMLPKSLGPKQTITEAWAVGPFSDERRQFNVSHEPEQGPINLAAKYGALVWKQVNAKDKPFAFDSLLEKSTDSSSYVYFRIESNKTQPAVMFLGAQLVRVAQNGTVVWETSSSRAFAPDADRVPLTLQAGSNDFLIRVHSNSRPMLQLSFEAASPLHVTLPDPLDSERLADRLRQSKDAKDLMEIPPQFAQQDWEKRRATGSVENGRKLFDSLGCSKCHSATPDSPGGGAPSLVDAGKRFTVPYVVESILLPSKVVSPLFRNNVIQTNDGNLFGGLIVNETADQLELRMTDTTLKIINKSDIKARKTEDRSPMPQGLVRTPDELQDVLAYVMRESN
jgi:putative heme-binding domain-containing protein